MCKSLKRLSNMETWLSGRKRLTANEVARKKAPGFESLRLRQESHFEKSRLEASAFFPPAGGVWGGMRAGRKPRRVNSIPPEK